MEKEQQIDKEYSLSTVPKEERKSYASLTIIWMGFVFVVTSMMAGGGLAEGLDFKHILLATFIGNIFLCLIAGSVSYIACKTGLTFALMTRYSFGEKGSRIASLTLAGIRFRQQLMVILLQRFFIADRLVSTSVWH